MNRSCWRHTAEHAPCNLLSDARLIEGRVKRMYGHGGNSDFDLPEADRQCPKCGERLKLARVAPSRSTAYEAHTFVCPACAFYFTARVEVQGGKRRRAPPQWKTVF